MSSTRGLFLTASLALGFGLVVAACSADGASINGFADNDAATTSLPDAGFPNADSGLVTGGDDGGDAGKPAVCGDGKKEAGEACDDANKNDGDGCSSTCTLEAAFEGDVCPGKTITLTSGGSGQLLTASVSGSTTGAFNHYGTACGGGSGRDVVYTFTPPSSGKATIALAADFPAMVAARATCDDSTSESKCADISGGAGGATTLEIPVFANTPVFLIVDGYGGSAGTFTLDISVSTAVCGNGIAELPESCDDGNKVDGDGCSATCTLEAGGVLSQCPGQPFTLTGTGNAPRKISFAGNTLTQGAQTQGSSGCFHWQGSNVVYAIKPDVDGSAKTSLHSGYQKANLHTRSDCGSSDFQLGCTQIEAPGNAELEFPVKANQWFFVFVDGHRSGSKDFAGPYSLDVTVTPGACGNGTLDGTEECDDGNAIDGDGCTAACKRETLSDVDTCPGHPVTFAPQADGSRTAVVSGTTTGLAANLDSCASASSSGPDAVFAVTPDVDGYLNADVTGPFNSTLSILSSCAGGVAPSLSCSWKGNASTEPFGIEGLGSTKKHVGAAVKANTTYFVVVDSHVTTSFGNGSGGPYRLDLEVTPAECGNGVVEGTESCDDGGKNAGDGCDANCQLEPVTARSTCADAEAITLTEATPNNWTASIASGTTNLLVDGNFFKTTSTTDKDQACWAPGRNAFFSVTAPASGVLRATAKSTSFDVVLGIRKPACAVDGPALLCANDGGKGNEESLALPVTQGEQVWIVVDGKVATEFGRFTLDVSITPSGCGDGFFVPSATEQCDDGNTTSGDGCSATCMLEAKAGIDTCPGTPLTITNGKGSITFSTETLNADYTGMCGGSAKDGVVKVTAPMNGMLKAKVRGMTGATVYARTTCNDPSTELAKTTASTCPSVVHDTVSFSVTSGTEYFIFVDGLEGATGVPTLDVSITP